MMGMERMQEKGRVSGEGALPIAATMCFIIALLDRWANYCCSSRRALDGSNTVLSAGMNVHDTTANTLVHAV